MPRRRSSGPAVDMFPFLSVLCSVIGVLMLFMMITISTRVIEAEEPSDDSPASSQERGVKDGIDAGAYRRLERDVRLQETALAERIQQQKELARRIQFLRRQLRVRKRQLAQARTPPAAPLRLNQPDKVRLVPDNAATQGKKPVFIEVSIDGYLRQPEKVRYAPLKRLQDGRTLAELRFRIDPRFAAFLREMEDQPDRFIVFLIHPNGVEAFQNVVLYIYKHHSVRDGRGGLRPRIRYGKEPFSPEWEFVRGK